MGFCDGELGFVKVEFLFGDDLLFGEIVGVCEFLFFLGELGFGEL